MYHFLSTYTGMLSFSVNGCHFLIQSIQMESDVLYSLVISSDIWKINMDQFNQDEDEDR